MRNSGWLVLALVLWGCADDDQGERNAVFRFPDTNTSVVDLSIDDLERVPSWVVFRDSGTMLGDHARDTIFGEVAFALRLPDARFAAADRKGVRVHVFGPQGELTQSLGRRGAGPG